MDGKQKGQRFYVSYGVDNKTANKMTYGDMYVFVNVSTYYRLTPMIIEGIKQHVRQNLSGGRYEYGEAVVLFALFPVSEDALEAVTVTDDFKSHDE